MQNEIESGYFNESVDVQRDTYHASFIGTEYLDDRLSAQTYRPDLIKAINTIKSKHRVTTLSKIANGKITQGATPVFSEFGMKCLKVKNVTGVLLDCNDTDFIDINFANNNSRSKVKISNIIVNRQGAGSIGRCGIYLGSDPIWISDSLFKINVVDAECDPCFLVAYLSSWFGKRMLERGVQGSTGQLSLSQKHLGDVYVPKPAFKIQTAIGNKIRKAELHKVMAANLFNQSKDQFQNISGINLSDNKLDLIDKDIVKSDHYTLVSNSPPVFFANVGSSIGAQYYHPRRINAQMLATSTSSWSYLDGVAKRVNSSLSKESSVFLGLEAIDSTNGVINFHGLKEDNYINGYSVFEGGNILISKLRPYLNKVTIWPENRGIAYGSGELVVYKAIDINPYYLLFILRSDLILKQIEDVTSGSTHPRVDIDILDKLIIPRLEDKEENMIGNSIKAAYENYYESSMLIVSAVNDIDGVIRNTVDQDKLLLEGEQILDWINAIPGVTADAC